MGLGLGDLFAKVSFELSMFLPDALELFGGSIVLFLQSGTFSFPLKLLKFEGVQLGLVAQIRGRWV